MPDPLPLPDTDYVAADFDDVLFQIQNTTSSTFTILMPTAETGSGVTNDGTLDTLPYVYAGLPTQVFWIWLGSR
jgi:hypothetical protein